MTKSTYKKIKKKAKSFYKGTKEVVGEGVRVAKPIIAYGGRLESNLGQVIGSPQRYQLPHGYKVKRTPRIVKDALGRNVITYDEKIVKIKKK